MSDELKRIKKIYGEEMMHLCRELFPTILEKEGLLLKLLLDHLAPSRSIAEDIIRGNYQVEFKDWIYSFFDVEEEKIVSTNKTPQELLDEAGYILYECKTEADIQKFRKYYARGEALCTFGGGRLNRCYVFFAVKKNVDEIRREDFKNPKREDEYGTSVMSIQFSRGKVNNVSIKNRYNHTVNNPDSTYGNNLDNIIPGLTESFERCYGFEIDSPGKRKCFLSSSLRYVKGIDGKLYRYNVEIDAVYYCENNIIIHDGIVIDEYAKNKERYILAEHVVFDFKEKKVFLPVENTRKDSFIDSINSVGKIKNMSITKNEDNRIITIEYEEGQIATLTIDKHNAIVEYQNDYVENIGNEFLSYNKKLRKISLNNAKKVGKYFLSSNRRITKVSLKNVQEIDTGFLCNNESIKTLSLPSVLKIGDDFLANDDEIIKIQLPHVKIIGNKFLEHASALKEISLAEVEVIGDDFLSGGEKIINVNLPMVKKIGNNFLSFNSNLEEISLPNVEIIGDNFLNNNKVLKRVDMGNVKVIGSSFLARNKALTSVNFPKIEKAGFNFIRSNYTINEVNFPKLREIGDSFLESNLELKSIDLPSAVTGGKYFLYGNRILALPQGFILFEPGLYRDKDSDTNYDRDKRRR